ncbi:MAG: PepSY domain-containing protein [Kyrpidia tusciae]|nr:PepSY domain-containing protein [Kyrpidia tusciae]MBE3552037.1 PepSY domain-containing protein [Kyrpidia tusciae]
MIKPRLLAVGAALLVAGLGTSVSALAAEGPQFTAPVHGRAQWDIDWDEVHSSVQLTDAQKKQLRVTIEQAYQQALMPHAKITAKQAGEAALKAEPKGMVTEVKLHSVHGNVVYLVHMNRDGARSLVVVDAGNGNVLVHKTMMKAHGDD